jgi:hypothetical protein
MILAGCEEGAGVRGERGMVRRRECSPDKCSRALDRVDGCKEHCRIRIRYHMNHMSIIICTSLAPHRPIARSKDRHRLSPSP